MMATMMAMLVVSLMTMLPRDVTDKHEDAAVGCMVVLRGKAMPGLWAFNGEKKVTSSRSACKE